MTEINDNTPNFICPNCGANLRYNIVQEKFKCDSCGHEADITATVDTVEEFDFSNYSRLEQESVPFEGITVVSCSGCGAKLTFNEAQIAAACPMCGSSQISRAVQHAGIPPAGILPFKIDKQDADRLFHKWIKGLWFAPSKLKKSYQQGALQGQYIPFWTFDADVVSSYTGEGGRWRKLTDSDGNEETVTDWSFTSGIVTNSFDDIQICASNGESSDIVKLVLPFDTIHSIKPFANEYLAGFQAEIYTRKADDCFNLAKEEMEDTMRSLCSSNITRHYDTARIHSVASKYTAVTYKHVLLPVWTSAFSYGGKTFRYVINGETGVVDGSHPYSPVKIICTIIVIAAIICALIATFSNGEVLAMTSFVEALFI